jgi:hypothetical protein
MRLSEGPMQYANLQDEADHCRKAALNYLGKPEAPFLLRVAREFDRLATWRNEQVRSPDVERG